MKDKELFPTGFPTKKNKITLYSLSAEYIQDQDCCDSSEESTQSLTITTQDGGGGFFYTIETKRWAIDDIEEFNSILEDFNKRIE